MPRTVSSSFRRQITAQQSGDVPLMFVEITHADLTTPIRVVSDTASYVWNGNTWTGVMFEFQLLTDGDGPPESRMTVPNIDTSLGQNLERLGTPPSVQLWVLSSADFDLTVTPRVPLSFPSVEYNAQNLFLYDVAVDAVQVSAVLRTYDYAREFFSRIRTTQDRAPGCWR
jgi:hypothetical protein